MDRQNAEEVLQEGKLLQKWGRMLLWLLLPGAVFVGLALFFVGMIQLGAAADSMDFFDPVTFTYVLAGLGCLGVGLGGLGFVLNLVGTHFVGLGQIAVNTLPVREKATPATAVKVQPVPKKPAEAETPCQEAAEEEPGEDAPCEEAPAQEETAEEPQTEEVPEDTPEEEEEEPDWHALLEQDDALIPGVKTPEEMVEQLPPPGKSGRRVSPALMNILRNALNTQSDEDGERKLIVTLRNGNGYLTKPHEKEILGYLLHTPDGDIRAATERIYDALNKK